MQVLSFVLVGSDTWAGNSVVLVSLQDHARQVVEILPRNSFRATGYPSSAAFELFDGSLQLRDTDSFDHHHQTPAGFKRARHEVFVFFFVW